MRGSPVRRLFDDLNASLSKCRQPQGYHHALSPRLVVASHANGMIQTGRCIILSQEGKVLEAFLSDMPPITNIGSLHGFPTPVCAVRYDTTDMGKQNQTKEYKRASNSPQDSSKTSNSSPPHYLYLQDQPIQSTLET